MINWIKDNIKWILPTVTVISFIAGVVGGYYKAVNDFEVHLIKVELKVDQSANNVKTEIMTFIQERIFTDWNTKLHETFQEKEGE